jgi:hypothetical protein
MCGGTVKIELLDFDEASSILDVLVSGAKHRPEQVKPLIDKGFAALDRYFCRGANYDEHHVRAAWTGMVTKIVAERLANGDVQAIEAVEQILMGLYERNTASRNDG